MNPSAAVDWLPALAVLGIGLLAGAVLAWKAMASARRARRNASLTPGVEVRDLAGKRDALVRQLQEMEDTAAKRTPSQLAQERYQLELDAARALLALEELGAPGGEPAATIGPAARPEPSHQSSLRGFLWGVGSATAVLLLGFFVYLSAKPRETGGSLTGNLPERGSAAADPATAAEEAQIKSAIARNPDDLEARLALAQLSIERRDYMTAWNETAKVLERKPGNPRALAYQAVVRLAMGQTAVAEEMLRKSVEADPELYEARAWLAMAYARMGRMSAARSTIAVASRRFPDRAADLQGLLADLEREATAPGSAGGAATENPHAGVPTPGAASDAAAGSVPAAQGRRVAGTIDLDPALKATATSGGMMGQEFPERVLIEARLDADGDPTTRAPTDPRARLDDVKAGRTDVRLVLKRP